MSGASPQPDHNSHIKFAGNADRVLQARDIHGDVHLGQVPDTPAKLPPLAMAPNLPTGIIERKGPATVLLGLLTAAAAQEAQPGLVALTGPGGFGKTKLAIWICHQAELRELFPDGVMWVDLGPRPAPERLVATLADLTARITGRAQPAYQTLPAARDAFAAALGTRQILLVIDDAWRTADVEPFLIGGPRCVRLVTTRRPPVASGRELTVDAMPPEQALTLLRRGMPDIDSEELTILLARSGRWPLALSLLNDTLRSMHNSHGMPVADAIAALAEELDHRGVIALDQLTELTRERAIGATLAMSMDELRDSAPGAFDRYISLAAFGSGEPVPLSLVERLWGMSAIRVLAEYDRFSNRSLVESAGAGGARLHDVIRDQLRRSFPEEIRQVSRQLLAISKPNDGWHLLPQADDLWPRLASHFVQADRVAELAELLRDMRFLVARLRYGGPVAIESDLQTYQAARPGDIYAISLSAIVRQESHLLVDNGGAGDLGPTFYNRMFGRPGVSDQLHHVDDTLPEHTLVALHALPDRADSRMTRVLTGHDSRFRGPSLAWLTDGRLISIGYDDRTLRIRDIRRQQAARAPLFTSSLVTKAGLSPDGRHLALRGFSTVTVIESATGRFVARWRMPSGEQVWDAGPADFAWGPDSATLAIATLKSAVTLWWPFDRERTQTLTLPQEADPGTGQLHKSGAVAWHATAGLAYLTTHCRLYLWIQPTMPVRASAWKIGLLRADCAAPGLSWRPDGKRLAIAFGNRLLLVDPIQRKVVWQLDDAQPWNKVSWQPNGQTLAAPHGDDAVALWSAHTDQVQRTTVLNQADSNVADLAWDAAGEYLAVATADTAIRVWQPLSAPHGHVKSSGGDGVTGIAWHPSDDRLALAKGDKAIVVVRAESPDTVEWTAQIEPEQPGHRVVWSADGKLVMHSASSTVWDGATGASVEEVRKVGDRWPMGEIICWPTSRRISMLNPRDQCVRLLDPSAGYRLISESGRREPGDRLAAVNERGCLVAIINHSGGLKIETASSSLRTRLDTGNHYFQACFLPGDRRLAATRSSAIDRSYRLVLWDIAAVQVVATAELHDTVKFLIADPAGIYLAVISERAVSLYDAATLRILHQLPVNGIVHACSFDSLGTQLAVAGAAGVYIFGIRRNASPACPGGTDQAASYCARCPT